MKLFFIGFIHNLAGFFYRTSLKLTKYKQYLIKKTLTNATNYLKRFDKYL